jgi:AraC family transcriptional regulator
VIRPAESTEPTRSRLLARGAFLGSVQRRLATADVVLAEVDHGGRRTIPRHIHADSYFSLLLTGSYQDSLGRQTRTVRPLGATFSPPGFEHSDRVGEGGARFFTLTVGPSVLNALHQRRDSWRRAQLWDEGEVPLQLLRLFATLARAPDTLDSLVLEDRLTVILGSAEHNDATRERRCPVWVDGVRSRSNECLRNSPGVIELAREAGIHPVYLSRTFRKFIGYGPAEYRARARVAAAGRLLATSDLPLAQISARFGFADQSHMTRAFASVIGATPAVYRRLIRERAQ